MFFVILLNILSRIFLPNKKNRNKKLNFKNFVYIILKILKTCCNFHINHIYIKSQYNPHEIYQQLLLKIPQLKLALRKNTVYFNYGTGKMIVSNSYIEFFLLC